MDTVTQTLLTQEWQLAPELTVEETINQILDNLLPDTLSKEDLLASLPERIADVNIQLHRIKDVTQEVHTQGLEALKARLIEMLELKSDPISTNKRILLSIIHEVLSMDLTQNPNTVEVITQTWVKLLTAKNKE